VGALVNLYCTLTEVLLNLTEVFLTLTEVFPCFFLCCKANARVKLAETEHGLHSSKLVVICVVHLLFVLFCVLFVCKCVLPLGDNPIAVNKYHIIYIKIRLVGQDSIVGIVTCDRLCSLGIELWWVWDFWYLCRLALGPTQPPVEWILGSVSQREERVVDP
jgi:hypothetical protein